MDFEGTTPFLSGLHRPNVRQRRGTVPKYILVGLAVGVAVGAGLGEPGIGIAVGAGIGVALWAAWKDKP